MGCLPLLSKTPVGSPGSHHTQGLGSQGSCKQPRHRSITTQLRVGPPASAKAKRYQGNMNIWLLRRKFLDYKQDQITTTQTFGNPKKRTVNTVWFEQRRKHVTPYTIFSRRPGVFGWYMALSGCLVPVTPSGAHHLLMSDHDDSGETHTLSYHIYPSRRPSIRN